MNIKRMCQSSAYSGRGAGISFFIIVFVALFGFTGVNKTFASSPNLLTNPGAETNDFTGWVATAGPGTIGGHDNGWAIINDGAYVHGGTKSFVSSYGCTSAGVGCGYDTLTQEINLSTAGYSNSAMDAQPEIDVGTFVRGSDAGSGTDDPYRFKVILRDASHNPLVTYDTGDSIATGSWVGLSHVFTSYGAGVRYIYVEQDGRSSAWWSGQYGATFDDASVVVVDSTAPVISGVATSVSGNNVTITWTTDELASSYVVYGTTASYGSTSPEIDTSPRVTSHRVTLTGLNHCDTYNFQVKSNDVSSNLGTSTDAEFKTHGCVTKKSTPTPSSSSSSSSSDSPSSSLSDDTSTSSSSSDSSGGTTSTPPTPSVTPPTPPTVDAPVTPPAPPAVPPTPPAPHFEPFSFAKVYRHGNTSGEIKTLQQFLNTHGFQVATTGDGSLGNETNYFGTSTKAALIKFQEEHAAEILTPQGLTKGTGIFGPYTKKFINSLLSQNQ